MSNKNFKLGLFGKKYLDEMYYFDKFEISETNIANRVDSNIGGIYNFKKILNKKINFHFFEDGERHVKILNDRKNSTRTSILQKSLKNKHCAIIYPLLDWLHISYIDDLDNLDQIAFDKPTSIDFCRTQKRENYADIIDKCSLVFDSRERKNLYKNIKTNTPIILHDPHGCECIVNNKIEYSFSSKKIKNLYVNGAGDIFCGIFLWNYYNLGMQVAMSKTCAETTENLIKINEI